MYWSWESDPAVWLCLLAAAREGVSTMLVERYGSFGGNITQAHVASIAWYRYDQTVEAGGIGVEFEVQLPGALTAIRLLMSVLPALLLTAASVVAWFYPLTRQRHAEILNELARRRGAE